MNCYCYDEKTKEFCGIVVLDKNPEETRIQNKFVPLIPANATLIEPPITNNGAIVFEENGWVIKPDYRGCSQINLETLTISTINYIGEIKQGYMLLESYYNSDEYKQKQDEENQLRKATLAMTKYDFYKYVCKPRNINYSRLMEIVNSNEEIAAAWNLCEKVYRGDKLLNKYTKEFLSITDNELDSIFEEVNNGI